MDILKNNYFITSNSFITSNFTNFILTIGVDELKKVQFQTY
jgi:hypothetical protein